MCVCQFVSIPDHFSQFTNYIKSAKVFMLTKQEQQTLCDKFGSCF